MASRVSKAEDAEGVYDSLDDRRLQAGDQLYIKWAGSIMQVEVQIFELVATMLIEGVAAEAPCYRAYFTLSVQGDGARIYLRGFEAQRVV